MSNLKLWEQVKYFKPEEFDSPDSPGSGINMNIEFIKLLDSLRDKCGFPLKINSGYRTKEHNEKVGGVDSSAHTNGCACDIAIKNGREKFDLVRAAIETGIVRVGIGDSFVHVDMDFNLPQRVLWTYKDKPQ